MKFLKFIPIALCLGAASIQAQNPTEVEQLKKQLQEMRENFERVQREQREQIDTLSKKIDELTKSPSVANAPAATSSPMTAVAKEKSADQKKLEEQLAAELGAIGATNAAAPTAASASDSKLDLSKP